MPPPGVCLDIIKERQHKDGVGTLKNPNNFQNQDYENLLQFYLAGQWRFIDEMFPPDRSSIGENLLSEEQLAQVEWVRPTRLEQNPYLIVGGISRFDFAQGQLGNCWFLAAVGALTFKENILQAIFPAGQSFQKNYAGIFHFRFWRFGKWVDVVIDDKLPTINGQLIFAKPVKCKDPVHSNEYWPALLEKAYAKVCGSYADMQFGAVSEALMDFTGGVYVTLNLQNGDPQKVWELIYNANKANSMMGCGTPGRGDKNQVLPNGLVEGHAYTVTGVAKVISQNKPVDLVRLFNPWGSEEWRGDWSDISPLWSTVNEKENYRKVAEDGEFWMSGEDFCKTFCQLDICSVSPAFLDGSSENHWTYKSFDGSWLAGSTAGGRMELKDTFWRNPKFQVTIKSCDKNCGPNVLLSLMQKPDKRNRRLTRKLFIGFSIFKLPDEKENLGDKSPVSLFNDKTLVACTSTLYDCREVMNNCRLEAGEYLIVPYTYNANQTASFLLSVWSKTETHINETFTRAFAQRQFSCDDNQKVPVFGQASNQFKEINAEQLQKILNERTGVTQEDAQSSEGFSTDACQSIIAMMDHSVTGTLNTEEFQKLLDKVDFYKDLFKRMDGNKNAILSLRELRHAMEGTGYHVSDHLLKLINLRYGDYSGKITLQRFIHLALRLRCMSKIFQTLGKGHSMQLKEHEWMYLTMYS
ncbi:calpain-A-like [Trichomycterus rosablanca]|uniref:calpain-A-like n=1 Tax=Trichomycterus rosablanca TaxID=2290929 RepID=UPI002F357FAA